MNFTPVKKLEVWRTLSNAEQVMVGWLGLIEKQINATWQENRVLIKD